MKAVLIPIQPYYVFLIIARIMGWCIPQEKTVEVRKDYPKDDAWNKRVHIYCSKNRKSFNRIPKQYQPFMEKLLGKVIGEFVCDWHHRIETVESYEGKILECSIGKDFSKTALTKEEILNYAGRKFKWEANYGVEYLYGCYGWHISDLKIYDKPKELGEFRTTTFGEKDSCSTCENYPTKENGIDYYSALCNYCKKNHELFIKKITRPPQSWCYVEGSHE